MWDPALYQRFATERSRPFFDLTARIGIEDPGLVADLGCGPGDLTATLATRWPAGQVRGIDNSPEMIAAATKFRADRPDLADRLSFALGDVAEWQPDEPVDVIVSNAVLQWVPEHLAVLTRWVCLLSGQGWLAFQVPGNFDQPSHRVLRELAGSARWQRELAGVQLNRQAFAPERYLELLAGAGLAVDAWETTYLHVLTGQDPIVRWYRGTGLRPVLAALGPDRGEEFLADYASQIRVEYPAEPHGTIFPFRRVFVVARRP